MSKKEKIIKSKDLVLESWQIYRKHILKFLEVFVYGLVGMAPLFVVLALVAIYSQYVADQASGIINIIMSLIAIILLIISLYIALIYSVRAKVASILLLKNNFTSAKKNFKEAKPYFVEFLGVSALVAVLVIAWIFAFIIPAIIFIVYYSFAQYALVIEGKRPFSAVERSYDLVKNYWWPVFGRLALISLIGMIIYGIISKPLAWWPEQSAPAMFYGIFTNIVLAVLSPYFIIYTYKLYQSLSETNK